MPRSPLTRLCPNHPSSVPTSQRRASLASRDRSFAHTARGTSPGSASPGVGAPLAGRLEGGPHTHNPQGERARSRVPAEQDRPRATPTPPGPPPPRPAPSRPLTRRSPVARVPAPATRGLATLTGPRARSAAQSPVALAVAPGVSALSPHRTAHGALAVRHLCASAPAGPPPFLLCLQPPPPSSCAPPRPAPCAPPPGPAARRRARARTALRGRARSTLCLGARRTRWGAGGGGERPARRVPAPPRDAPARLPAVLPAPGRLADLAFLEGIPRAPAARWRTRARRSGRRPSSLAPSPAARTRRK